MFGQPLSLPKFPNHFGINTLEFHPKVSSHIIHIADTFHLQDDREKIINNMAISLFESSNMNILSSLLTITLTWLAKTLTSRENRRTFRKPREALTMSRVLQPSRRQTLCSSCSNEDTSMESGDRDETVFKHLFLLYNQTMITNI